MLNSVLNANQTSFNNKMASHRTLSYSGEKATWVSVKSFHATTHSCTMMPIITAASQLLRPVFICPQEMTDRFPVGKNVFSITNVVATCNMSSKFTTSFIEHWIREVLGQVTTTRFLLFVDQWSPQTVINRYENNLTKDQLRKLMAIPRKTTSTK